MQALTSPSYFSKFPIHPWRKISKLRFFSVVSEASLPSSQSRGGLPRFYSQVLPSSKGNVVRVQGDEFWHMTKVLRLNVDDRVELFNGAGGVVEGCIQRIDRTGLDFVALEDSKTIVPRNTQWHVFAAFGTLKGGRADWLVEKCTELGASSLTPLLTERSPSITENRVDRLQRVVLAAIKQCQRLHGMTVKPPIKIGKFLPVVAQTKFSFLAAAEATPLLNTLSTSEKKASGLLIIGPEGDFTEEEVKLMTEAGAIPVGLGPCRLRVETATIALLATLMLWADSQLRETCIESAVNMQKTGDMELTYQDIWFQFLTCERSKPLRCRQIHQISENSAYTVSHSPSYAAGAPGVYSESVDITLRLGDRANCVAILIIAIISM